MKLLCPGPTSVNEEVIKAMANCKTNPDLDPEYKIFHRNMEKKISKLLNTKATSFIMLGEGILGLEASIVSLMEKGERVLVIYNGFFGEGFADYVRFYGGEAVKYEDDFRHGINLEKLENFLEKDHDFKIATMVHCETPSGLTNDIEAICTLLKKYNILTIVDSVSAMGGEKINFDSSNVDCLLGGSQKCISAPAGLTLVTLSESAKEKIENRKEEIPSYYMNFKNHYDCSFAPFPYTMNENLVYALDKALDITLESDFANLHEKYASSTREVFTKAGFELYPKDSFSNTVTAVLVPEEHNSSEIELALQKKGIIIGKGVGPLKENIIRIGHMGQNINYENFEELYSSLDEVFEELNIKTNESLLELFKKTNVK
ncbi:pyridoxal-phosphate-dependent aminotransferase family protein [Peptoniphilus stercorisuis]|uniref:Aspartate aminotransferase-like enzyme n=1 Tax=Peptoniphilus stercorisuis TaxID=1436965 RepID=A0ABS4KA07_9FIRM|nr:alanine--glyoxylate aminotransferase family protein [Peptoniphilus stercorisuis]MBP2024599.1 aspartate aminotransferase-like enzyme [Peptoniphilus stercorisuis]